jgi:hypothetical protein
MKFNGSLPRSKQIGNLIALPTPCGNTVFYPLKLALLGTQGKYSMFCTIANESGQAYLCTTQPDRVRIRAVGTPEAISQIYEIPNWKEVQFSDENGVFFYKEAPSLQELNKFGDSISS